MRTRILAERADALDERDLVLYLALGLVAASRRLDAVLARHGRRADPGGDAGAADGGEPALYFVLGLIALRQRAMAMLTDARCPAAPEPAPPVARWRGLRGLLR